jgi:hypothetical protein
MAGRGIFDGALHAREGGLVEDGVDAAAGAGEGGRVGEIGFEEVDAGGYVGERAGGEIVETTDDNSRAREVMASGKERLREMGADETRDAGDEVSGHSG